MQRISYKQNEYLEAIMKISVFLDGLEGDKALSRFIIERVGQLLQRHRRAINLVEIRVRDVNGHKGGVDKECKICVVTPLSDPVVVTATHADSGQAFRAALKKLVPNLRATLDRTIFRAKRTRDIIRSRKEAA
jgi:hypothetical protein